MNAVITGEKRRLSVITAEDHGMDDLWGCLFERRFFVGDRVGQTGVAALRQTVLRGCH